MNNTELDAVTLAVIHNGLQQVCNEMDLSFVRSAFSPVISEALDRLSRDLENIASIYKRLLHAEISIITLAEGEVSELHIGLKGTMNALFLKDLALKIRRGQRGRVTSGHSAGGLSYGYEVVREFDPEGNPIRGKRRINADQASIVRRIFTEYAGGKSPRMIARWNAGDVPLMLLHPKSAGHGLNLQHGGHVLAWFGLPWSLEMYLQTNARLRRRGQTRPVINHRIIARDTVDETTATALVRNNTTQSALLAAL